MNKNTFTAPVQDKDRVSGNGGNAPDPKLRRRRRLHRTLGLSTSVFLVVLVVTGLLLQHEDDLSLDSRFVASTALLNLYAIRAPEDYAACDIPDLLVVQLGQVLFLQPFSEPSGETQGALQRFAQPLEALVGCVDLANAVLIATRNQLLLFTHKGEFIETQRLPYPLNRIGRVISEPGAQALNSPPSPEVILETRAGILATDADVLELSPRTSIPAAVQWSAFQPLNPRQLSALQARYLANALSWQQVVRDVHSGQILGFWGRLLIDLVALAALLLALTGIGLWWRGRNGSRAT